MARIRVLVLVWVGSLVGCGATEYTHRLSDHVIAITASGNVMIPETEEKVSDFGKYVKHLLDQVDEAWDDRHQRFGYPESAPRRILIHVHGGLNDRDTSLEVADRVIEEMAMETGEDWHYPIFITWPSGGLDTYEQHLTSFRQGLDRPWWWGWSTAPVFVVTDIGRGLVRMPRSLSYQLGSDLSVGVAVASGGSRNFFVTWKNAEAKYRVARETGLYRLVLGGYRRGFWVQGYRFLRYLVSLPVKIVTQSTVIDGMGQGAWDVMQHRIRNVFRRPREFELSGSRNNVEKIQAKLEQPATGALAVFLRLLRQRVAEKKAARYEITIVGHSMGAIVLNEALRHFPAASVNRIVYMAPACSIQETAESVVPFLEDHPHTEFKLLTLHPIAEVDEINYLDITPRGSLLEWIDNWYTTPISATHRRLGKWVNIMQALHLFSSVRERFAIKAFGVEPGSIPQRHGDFKDCPFWRREFWATDGPLSYHKIEKGVWQVGSVAPAE